MDKISISEFAKLTNWDNRFSSSRYQMRYGFGEYLNRIALQFHNGERWIYNPTIVWRGTMSEMYFPLIAVNGSMDKGVIINDRKELQEHAEKWLKNDFSMLDTPLTREVYPNVSNKSYEEFEKEVYSKLLCRNKSIVCANIYESACVTFALYAKISH